MMSLVPLAMTAMAFGVWLVFDIKSRIAPASPGTIVHDDAGRFQPEEIRVSDRYGLKGTPD